MLRSPGPCVRVIPAGPYPKGGPAKGYNQLPKSPKSQEKSSCCGFDQKPCNGYATLHTVRVSITPRAPGAARATQLTLTATRGPPRHQRARHPSKELSEGAPRREQREEEGAGRARTWR